MDADSSRRYTDREVAVVLRRASEIDETEGPGGSGALSRKDLEQIAREVGISTASITRALAELDHRREPGSWVTGAPRVHSAVRAVPRELGEDAMARLIRLVDERADGNGVISEALGSVRWTSTDTFRSTQVSITPGAGETTIRVVDKANPRLKRILHLVPAGWGLVGAASVVGTVGLAGVAAAGVFIAGTGVGLGAGRLVWNLISSRRAGRMERLAADLSREAGESVEPGARAKEEDPGSPSGP